MVLATEEPPYGCEGQVGLLAQQVHRDLAGERAHEVQRLEALLGEWDAVVRDEVHWEGVYPPSDLEALRKMGYLGDDED